MRQSFNSGIEIFDKSGEEELEEKLRACGGLFESCRKNVELTAFLIRARGCVPALFNVVWNEYFRSCLETYALQLFGDSSPAKEFQQLKVLRKS